MSEKIKITDKAVGLKIPYKEIGEFCKRHHIMRFSLFGSVLRDDFTEQSDIDVLVEFEEGRSPGLLKFSEMEEELSSIFEGRKIDLRTPGDLSRYFREDVMKEREVLYSET